VAIRLPGWASPCSGWTATSGRPASIRAQAGSRAVEVEAAEDPAEVVERSSPGQFARVLAQGRVHFRERARDDVRCVPVVRIVGFVVPERDRQPLGEMGSGRGVGGG
jgi:hypothetical protein